MLQTFPISGESALPVRLWLVHESNHLQGKQQEQGRPGSLVCSYCESGYTDTHKLEYREPFSGFECYWNDLATPTL